MNFGTAVATIRLRAKKSASEDPTIKRAIIDTIALHRREKLFWNQARLAYTLIAGQATYGPAPAHSLPADIVALTGERGYLDTLGSADQRTPVLWVSREKMDALRAGSSLTPGATSYFSWWDEQLEIYPPAANSTDILRVTYVQDAGTPVYSATTADPPVYSFFQPDGTTALTDAYTSPWFAQKKGFNLTCWHAEWQLWTSDWRGLAGQGDTAAQKYAEALDGAQIITDSQSSARRIQPWIPLYDGR